MLIDQNQMYVANHITHQNIKASLASVYGLVRVCAHARMRACVCETNGVRVCGCKDILFNK